MSDPNDKVLIYDGVGRCYWKQDGWGYTSAQHAGVFTRKEAKDLTSHAGPEKKIEFHLVPDDHIPTLKAERDGLAGLVVDFRAALEQAVKSAHPHPVEHPTMTAAWKVMRAALSIPVPAAAERMRVERMVTEQALAAIADGEGDAQIIARSTLAALRAARGGQ